MTFGKCQPRVLTENNPLLFVSNKIIKIPKAMIINNEIKSALVNGLILKK
jgi:hypothetical protein